MTVPPKHQRVIVLLHPSCSITQIEIEKLLAETGVVFDEILIVRNLEELKAIQIITDLVLVIVDDKVMNEKDLEDMARECASAGAKVIVVFGPGVSHSGVHNIAENYGTQCPWSATDITEKITTDNSPPTNTTGIPARRKKAKQVDC